MEKRNYQRELDDLLAHRENHGKKLLIHSCCGPCSTYVLAYLGQFFELFVYYYNPNIHPYEELALRIEEQKKVIAATKTTYPIHLLVEEGNPRDFYQAVKAYRHLPEGSQRCYSCYELRLKKAAEKTVQLKLDYLATTLSVSPYKKAQWLNQIGEELAQGQAFFHLPHDFKKKGGYAKSVALSKDLGLYRQDYCGCIYSMKESIQRQQQGENK